MVKIIAVKYRLKGLGGYDYEKKIILYDKALDRFPKLKEKTIAHELEHAKACKGNPSFFRNLKRELLDYPKTYFDDDYYRFRAYVMNEGKKKKLDNRIWLKMFILEIIVALYSSFLTVVLLPVYLYKIWKVQRPR
jgi:hypothetical protein